ncbi:MAG: PD40 domain-containing protein [Bacteroidetes bacterium]|nr:PD40 domain-containing protein [Bacteroidota bacterium]
MWLSEKNTENKFSTPHPIEGLSDILNSGNYEPSVSINASENIIYFASERSGGFGGLDLYRTIKKDGVWQAAENLGPTINTEYDEDSPYIDPNNSTLYFSSKGHSSMGGYDIFKTYLIDSTWTYPMNMGFPLNSNSDDIFFTMTEKYNRGYFSSDRTGGKGKMDIYRISFASEREQLAEIRGKVKKGDKLIAAKSKLTVIDKLDDTTIAEYYSDSLTGDYHILLDHNNKYLVKVETEGFREYKRTFTIPEQEDYYSFYQEVHCKLPIIGLYKSRLFN